MANREEKIGEILRFVSKHPESFASRAVLRRFVGNDYEMGDELFHNLEQKMQNSQVDETEIDLCYDIIK